MALAERLAGNFSAPVSLYSPACSAPKDVPGGLIDRDGVRALYES